MLGVGRETAGGPRPCGPPHGLADPDHLGEPAAFERRLLLGIPRHPRIVPMRQPLVQPRFLWHVNVRARGTRVHSSGISASVTRDRRNGQRADKPSAPLAVTPDLGPALVVATSPIRNVAPSSAEEDVAVARTEESVGAGTAEEASLLALATVVGGEAEPQDVVAAPALDRYSACTGFQQLGCCRSEHRQRRAVREGEHGEVSHHPRPPHQRVAGVGDETVAQPPVTLFVATQETCILCRPAPNSTSPPVW